eukprot:9498732-Pyramimonas_sp.AAC.1
MAPKKAGGDRALGVLPHIARTWSRIRGAASDMWSDGLHDFSCTAMKGSSALSAALHRASLDESAVTMGLTVGTLLMDLAKFYDH